MKNERGSTMETVNQQLFISRMDANISYKTAILPLLPTGEVNILDYGGGVGGLSQIIKMSNPKAYVTIADISKEMLEIAETRGNANEYVLMPKQLPYNMFDAIILCSVLHEVEDKQQLIKDLTPSLRPGGIIIIRDGFAEESYNNKWNIIKPLDYGDAYDFYFLDCYDSIIFDLDLDFNYTEGTISGLENDLRAFVDTYTWGRESVAREKHENRLWMNKDSVTKLFSIPDKDRLNMFNLESLTFTPICQPNYFTHLQKIIKVDKMWNTHAIATIKKRK